MTKLLEWRQRRGYSLLEVSDLTGLSTTTVNLAERGLREISADTKVKFARRVGASVAELFELDPLGDGAEPALDNQP